MIKARLLYREKYAKPYAIKFQKMIMRGVPRKQAVLEIVSKLRDLNLPGCERTLYRWVNQYPI